MVRTAATILCILSLVWLAARTDSWATAFNFKQPQHDYYNLLVHGFLDGHLYMKAEVHPDLLSPDPAVRAHAPYLLDANLYHGRYYLYYGVAPAALVMLPYTWLTGHDLPLDFVTLLFVTAGFLAATRLYSEVRRRYFAGSPPLFDLLAIPLLAYGPLTPVLVRRAAHYELPIAAGYAFALGALFCLFRALHRERTAGRWLAGASLLLGLAVASRPNYLFALPILLGAVWLHRKNTPARPWAGLLSAAVVPAAGIGLLLAAYNYGRFGNPFEFGFKYGINSFFSTGKPLLDPSFLWPNLRWYYLTPPVITTYFPYCFPINCDRVPPLYYSNEAIHGQWLTGVFFLLGGAIFLRRLHRQSCLPPLPFNLFLSLLGWAGVTNLIFLLLLGVRADRYMVDFQAAFILLTTLLTGYGLSRDAPAGTGTKGMLAAAGTAALAACCFNFLCAIELFDDFRHIRPQSFAFLSQYGNRLDDWLWRNGFVHYGPLRCKVVFPPPAAGQTRQLVLLATGIPNKTDVLYANQQPDGTVALYLHHEGHGGMTGKSWRVEPGREYTLEVDLGSLYPPQLHPFFAGWSEEDYIRFKSAVRVTIDGEEVLAGLQQFHDSPSCWVCPGRNPGGRDADFPGRIRGVERLPPLSLAEFHRSAEPGVWRLQVRFPHHPPLLGQPLIASGVNGAGNLLLVQPLDDSTIRFGYDQWGIGMVESDPIVVTPNHEYTLEVFAGCQVARQRFPASWPVAPSEMAAAADLLRVWLDGRLVWTTPIAANQRSYDFAAVGHNLQGFSSALALFTGSLQKQALSDDEKKRIILRNLHPPAP